MWHQKEIILICGVMHVLSILHEIKRYSTESFGQINQLINPKQLHTFLVKSTNINKLPMETQPGQCLNTPLCHKRVQ